MGHYRYLYTLYKKRYLQYKKQLNQTGGGASSEPHTGIEEKSKRVLVVNPLCVFT